MDGKNQFLLDFLSQTDHPIFLTGKAGTGKTTLLHEIKNAIKKNIVVVAPTAVAALNAGGTTIHSFFQVPFGPLLPGELNDLTVRYSPDKLRILKCLELLIIDEISMVRVDTIDYLDKILRKVNITSRPFGGVQVLMIGDLFQLPPVSHNDWPILKNFYRSHYFFDSQVFNQVPMAIFELTYVYRQSDQVFINILNGIRENNLSTELLEILNSRHVLNHVGASEGYITLTTHNRLVSEINQKQLEILPGEIHIYKANVTGEFPKDAFPVDEELRLKAGAQVIMTKNDPSGKKQYYNGRSAKIIELNESSVKVQFLDDDSELEINPEVWNNVKYGLDQSDTKVSETKAGSFTQYPIKLAWAITVHKSQGLTFEKAFVDVSASFAHGQSYVALSRCRNLEGLILNASVTQQNIITDPLVSDFMKKAAGERPNSQMLERIINAESYRAIYDIFDFLYVKADWDKLSKMVNTDNDILNTVAGVAEKFLKRDFSQLDITVPIAEQTELHDRLKGAAIYFLPKIEAVIVFLNGLFLSTSDPKIEIQRNELINNSLNALFIKNELFKLLLVSFDIFSFREISRRANLGFKLKKKNQASKKEILVTNEQLYEKVLSWRSEISKQKNIPDYLILPEKSAKLIANRAPKTIEELSSINGIGPAKAKEIGSEILKIINTQSGTQQLFG
jgi:hypothetical protein